MLTDACRGFSGGWGGVRGSRGKEEQQAQAWRAGDGMRAAPSIAHSMPSMMSDVHPEPEQPRTCAGEGVHHCERKGRAAEDLHQAAAAEWSSVGGGWAVWRCVNAATSVVVEGAGVGEAGRGRGGGGGGGGAEALKGGAAASAHGEQEEAMAGARLGGASPRRALRR